MTGDKKRGRPKNKKEEPENEPKKDNWEIVGWAKKSASGKSILVFDGEGENSKLMGIINKKSLMRLFNDDIEAVPIKEIPEE